MTWLYQNEIVNELPEGVVGFVYLITNTTNNRKYIGKKLATKSKTKMVKGKKKKIKVESDWKTYYGSNDELHQDIEKIGVDSFVREILRFCYTLTEVSYHEAKYQFTMGALESNDFYNSWIMVRCRKANLLKSRGKNDG